MSCTLVTAFYPIRSKFPSQQYMEWARNYFSVHAPIVLFTEAHLVPVFQGMRPPGRPLHIFVLPFSELETWSGTYPEEWHRQHLLNPEGHIQKHTQDGDKGGDKGEDKGGGEGVHVGQQTPELYALWAHKPAFVERAVDLNPFHTPYFFWCDIGAFRVPVPSLVQERFPQTGWFSHDRLVFQAMAPVTPSEKDRQVDGLRGYPITSTWNEVRMVGGLWGGGAEACRAWKRACDTMRQCFFTAGRYAGNDQAVMLSVLLETPQLGLVLKPHAPYPNNDAWFYLEYALSSLSPVTVDMSYSG